ncbi:MAG: hypothetical protein RR295_09905, partial [Oscillospiraceae bacterium]
MTGTICSSRKLFAQLFLEKARSPGAAMQMKLQLCCPTPLDIYQARNIRHKVCLSFLENQCGTWYTANEPKISACMDTVRKAKQRDIEPME